MMMSYIPLGPHVYTCTDRFHEPIGAVGSLGPFVESEHDRTVAQASFSDLLFQLIFNVILGNLKESSVSQGWPPRASHPLIPPPNEALVPRAWLTSGTQCESRVYWLFSLLLARHCCGSWACALDLLQWLEWLEHCSKCLLQWLEHCSKCLLSWPVAYMCYKNICLF